MEVKLARYVPGSLKRRVPIGWKTSVRRSLARFRSAFGGGERGLCPTCGRAARFPFTLRNSEDVWCPHCLSSARTRHIARVLLRFAGRPELPSLREFARLADRDVYVVAANGSTAEEMRAGPRVIVSEYWEDVPPGERRGDVLCQDIQRLTFPDNSFDLVVSECVFEHVADYRRGFREVHRVLRPGGAHIFTIPYDPARPTLDRFAWKDGELVPTLPLELHGDPYRGTIPAITSFGCDLLDILREIGFETRIDTAGPEEIAKYRTYGHGAESGSFAFVSVKVGA